ncbi:outer membrane autotransporter barrel domain-containing protein [Stappia sp. 22II-S9-Z10]|nr:outer membrane autotransporter barrel domain-containing protein [Stappia sp. 22II-S9-Z10]
MGAGHAQTVQNGYPSCQDPTPSVPSSYTCVIQSSAPPPDGVLTRFVGATGAPGASAGRYAITNNATISASDTYGLYLLLQGGPGSTDPGAGGDGGTPVIINTAAVTSYAQNPAGGSDLGIAGIWDDPGVVFGVAAVGVGGLGGTQPPGVGGSSGGAGGSGGTGISVTNSGTITMSPYVLPYGAVALYGASIGGSGGDENQTAGTQTGGNGGAAGSISISNTGRIDLSQQTAETFAWGVAAEGIGGDGGSSGGLGGAGSSITVTHSGTIDVAPGEGIIEGARGIYAISKGGAGSISREGVDGGDGGTTGLVSLTSSGDITVTSSAVAPSTSVVDVSGGIVVIQQGGDGGISGDTSTNTTNQRAGNGGAVASDYITNQNPVIAITGGTITTTGDNLLGVAGINLGGNGGEGRAKADAGAGGAGGDVDIIVSGNPTITTDGTGSTGLLAQSIGGGGGYIDASSGIIDLNSPATGAGGAGGTAYIQTLANVDTGDTSGAGSVTTHGDNSAGMVAQSIGGVAGDMSDRTILFFSSPTAAGGGGAPGSATIYSGSTVTTTGSNSPGLLAQSIGGGGGSAGSTGGILVLGGAGGDGAGGGTVLLENHGDITTGGDASHGLVAQSIGGGGGIGGSSNGVLTVGGSGGGGGRGGRASGALYAGTIKTSGDYAYGALVQSVGGGGGDGGSVFDLSAVAASDDLPGASVGGAGGSGGNGQCANMSFSENCTINTIPELDTTVQTSGANAHAIVVQSIGGGGGSGGDSTVLAAGSSIFEVMSSYRIVGGSNGPEATGGTGGSGGHGGGAVVNGDPLAGGAYVLANGLTTSTTGSHAAGILAQSIGGGGGTGGSGIATNADLVFSLSTAAGGSGGDGGVGGATNVVLVDTLINPVLAGVTYNNAVTDAHGVVAQSIGGGGGMAGSSVARALTLAVPIDGVAVGAAIAHAVGGAGGGGGAGGSTDVALTGTDVVTYGAGSMGVIAQSIGNGGGTGGSASSMAAVIGSISGDTSVAASVGASAPGDGGNGGFGDEVTFSFDPDSSVVTHGDHANAVLLQSIGGGGGNAGIGSANTNTGLSDFSFTGTIALSAQGGEGGNGGNIVASTEAGSTIQTSGSGARGMVLQSIGGGGGTSQGGTIGLSASGTSEDGEDEDSDFSAQVTIDVGRAGANGGNGGTISGMQIGGNITTTGGDADGVLAQSIGGGGGLAGSWGNDAGDDSNDGDGFGGGDDDTDYTLTVNLGGTGGAGGNGGTIGGTLTSTVRTSGDWADGVVLQSIGGGGGVGASSLAAGSDATADAKITIGGANGEIGTGGNVGMTIDGGTITTSGHAAHALVMQSITGGGGMGGDGSDRASGWLRLGATQSAVAAGTGTVRLDNSTATLTTQGADAYLVLAQAVAGGGGYAGAGSAAADQNPSSHAMSIALGPVDGPTFFSEPPASNTVTINTGIDGSTTGDRAYGIVAQSIGGGGGVATTGSHEGVTDVTLGGGIGSGGNVNVTLSGTGIITRGAGAHAVIAQSIGGGGGIGGADDGRALNLRDNGAHANGGMSIGDGGSVTVQVAEGTTITTDGTGAYGIIAQSIGGGGGLGGDATSTVAGTTGNAADFGFGDLASVTVEGNVTVNGEGSVGVMAQSQGATGSTTSVSEVTVTGSIAAAQGTGIVVDGYTQIVNTGASASVTGEKAVVYYDNGVAQSVTAGPAPSFTLRNAGTIRGNVERVAVEATSRARSAGVDDPIGEIINRQFGVLADASLYQADIDNRGTVRIGRTGSADRLRVEGDVTQSGTGVLVADVDFAARQSDRIRVTGDASLDGRIALNTASIVGGRPLTVLKTRGTLTGRIEAIDSPLFDYALTRSERELAVYAADSDFAGLSGRMTASEEAVAHHLDAVFDSRNDDFGTLFAALDAIAAVSPDNYVDGLSQLSPGASQAAGANNFAMSNRWLGAMLSCPVFAEGSADLDEDSCIWGGASVLAANQSNRGGGVGYDADVWSLSAGVQVQVRPDWYVGASLGYENSSIDGSGGRQRTRGDSVVGGLSLKHDIGPWQLAAAVAGTYGSFDSRRSIGLPGFASTARGDLDSAAIAGRLRASYVASTGAFYAKPQVDLDVIYSHADGYTESGAGILNLSVDSIDEVAVRATPALELGARVGLGESAFLRAYARGGVSFSSLDGVTTSAHLAAAGPGVGDFDTTLPVADIVGHVAAGLEVTGLKGFGVRAEYDGAFGDGFDSHAGMVRLRWDF